MLVNNNNNFRNSIAPTVEDDLTYRNYIALLRTITGVKDKKGNWKDISINRALSAYRLLEQCEGDKLNQPSKHNYVDIEVLDTQTNEVFKFKTVIEAATFLDVKSTYISVYIKRQALCKRRYRLTGKVNKNKCEKVKLINIQTDEVISFDTVKQAAEKLNMYPQNVYNAINRDRVVRKTWKVVKG